MANSIDELSTIYYSTPIPRDTHVLTVLGVVFDKVYFPGVYIPTEGFDQSDLDKEIERIDSLNLSRRPNNIMLPVLKFISIAKKASRFL